MTLISMDPQRVKKFWLEEGEESLLVAWHLFEKADYSYALFFGHLAIEKLLKAVFVIKKGEQAPYIHNLYRLAEMTGIPLSETLKDKLIEITAFNLESRYPDERRSFRKRCTEEFTRQELNEIEGIFKWLKSMLLS
jgi:HEPN domain-containing protein